MLKSKGPRTDPCGTPNIISSQQLYAEFILALCFSFAGCCFFLFSKVAKEEIFREILNLDISKACQDISLICVPITYRVYCLKTTNSATSILY